LRSEGAWNEVGTKSCRQVLRALATGLLKQLAMNAVIAAVVPQPVLAITRTPLSHESRARKVWRVRYIEGPITVERHGGSEPLAAQSRVKIRIEEGKILLFRKRALLSIPVTGVTELDYRVEVYSRSRQVFGPEGASGALANCAEADQAGALCVAMVLPLYAASAPFHYREHFIHITWHRGSSAVSADDAEQEVELKVGKGGFRGLIAALERATGKKCERIEPRAVAN